jgi:RHS repeat-associated protein
MGERRIAMRFSRLLFAFCLAIAPECFAQQTPILTATPTWTQSTPSGSGPRAGGGSQSTAYDPANDRLIVFGGYDPTANPCCPETNNVWILLNATSSVPTWQQLIPTGPNGFPQGRQKHSAVYDPATNRLIIFGGGQLNGGIFNPMFQDTWVLTNANGMGGTPEWMPLAPQTANGSLPAPRTAHGAVYNQATNEMFVFGGGNNGIASVPNDLWVLENANGVGTPLWVQLPEAGAVPGHLENFASSYDPSTNRWTTVGGCCGYTNATNLLALNRPIGTPQWTTLAPSGTLPPAGDAVIFGYDPQSNGFIVHGMQPGGGSNATWLLTDANAVEMTLTWVNIIPEGTAGSPPEGVLLVGSAYNAASKKLIHAINQVDAQGNFAPDVWVLSMGSASPTPPPPNIGQANSTSSSGPTSAQDNLGTQGSTSEPISTGSGNYFYSHTDLTMPGRGMPLVFQRSYNSLDNYTGPLGVNWTHSYNIFLTLTPTGAFIKWGDGHGETFTLSGATYIPQPGVFNTLIKNADGSFVLTRKDQTQFGFSVVGRVASVQDKNGNTISLTYDSNGNLTLITDTVGRNLTLSYDASNRITQITDPISRTVSFQYDANNNIAQVTDPAAGVTTFAYDANHRVTSITQPNGQTLLQNTYDSSGRVISQSGGRGFATTLAYNTPNSGQTTIVDARGNQTIHSYDSSLRIVHIKDASGATTLFTYDTNNDRTSLTNQNGNITNFIYDGQGNVTGILDPLTNASAFTFDAKNDLLTATNAMAKTTTFTYDAKGNLKTVQDALSDMTAFAYDTFGELTSKTDARSNATSFSYDSSGNLTRITDALGHTTALSYDGIGRLTSITDPNSHTATAAYDALSRLVKIADPLGNQTLFAYDPVGNLLKITDANGNATGYGYDAMNNLVTVTDALGHITRYSYDANNNRVTFTNAKGNATSYAYDTLNRLGSVTDPLSFMTSYAYDPVGNVLAVTDAKGQINRFTYDALNRLLAIAYADGNNVAYSYDADGNRTTMADSHGTTTYAYDSLDRLTLVIQPGGKVVAYAYDAVGNRKSLTYPDGKNVVYTYDQTNRLTEVTDWLARNTGYSYDAASNLTKTVYPNGTNIAFGYDAANRLLSVTNSLKGLPAIVLAYTLDAVGNRLTLSLNGISTKYSYDALNELLGAQLGPLKTSWNYDAVGNRLKQTSALGTTNYTYDAADRLLMAGLAAFTYDANGNQTSAMRSLSSKPIIYRYDAANRLISSTGGPTNSAFAYDGDGNRVSQSVGKGTYTYLNDVAAALPVVLQESGPDGNISYAYGLGLISESSSAFNFFYHYDGLGSVIALTDAGGKPAAAYAYDPWGNPLLTLPDSAGTKNKFRFTGEALDPGTQLYYLRARYYDASTGRFIGRDSFPGASTHPLSWNAYLYALSNPLRYTDPAGLSATENNQASYTANCSINCEMIVNVILNAGASALRVLAKLLAVGNAETSISGTSAGFTTMLTVSSVVNNPDTVKAELRTIQTQKYALQQASGFLENGDTVNQIVSIACTQASSYAIGPCAASPTARSIVIKAAHDQHISLCATADGQDLQKCR